MTKPKWTHATMKAEMNVRTPRLCCSKSKWTPRGRENSRDEIKRFNVKKIRRGVWFKACHWQRCTQNVMYSTACVCVCGCLRVHTLVWNETIGATGFDEQSVSQATATYPSPPTLLILRRKSTEFRLGGFHLRISSHLPALYLCRTKNDNYGKFAAIKISF